MTLLYIKVWERAEGAPKVNDILTEYGDLISARFGFHAKKNCPEFSINAVICVILIGNNEMVEDCCRQLNKLKGVEAFLNLVDAI